MTVKHKCSERVWNDTRRIYQPCSRNATVQCDGKRYCWQHDPEYVAKKATERRAAWKAERDREAAKYRRIARNAKLGALVTPELAALLERLGTAWTAKLSDKAYALTLAARIREALAQEGQEEGE